MWEHFESYFKSYPAQAKVARYMMDVGLSIRERKIYLDKVKVSYASLAKALEVDQRVVASTIDRIMEHDKLKIVYSKFMPSCNLKDVADEMGWQVLEISIHSPARVGLLGDLAQTIANGNVSIRQAIGEDPASRNGLVYIITENPIPGYVIENLRTIDGIHGITIR